MKRFGGRRTIHDLPLVARPEYHVGSTNWINLGKTRARLLKDMPKVPHGTVGVVTKHLGLGHLQVTLEDGTKHRMEMRFLQLIHE